MTPNAAPSTRLLSAAAVLIVAAGLGGCSAAGLASGAAAEAGIAASQERGLEGAATDLAIRAEINRAWLDSDLGLYRRVGLTVHAGRVLLSGTVPEAAERATAVRLAWQPDAVREVINEIRIGSGTGLAGLAAAEAARAKLKTRLLGDARVRSVNFAIDVHDGILYLLGIARSAAERDRVVGHARAIGGIRRVIDHITVEET